MCCLDNQRVGELNQFHVIGQGGYFVGGVSVLKIPSRIAYGTRPRHLSRLGAGG